MTAITPATAPMIEPISAPSLNLDPPPVACVTIEAELLETKEVTEDDDCGASVIELAKV